MSTPPTHDAAAVRDIIKAYTKVAFVYDAWTWATESRSLRVALERAAIRDGERVLEVAVGTGLVFREILRRNPSGRNVGIDLTEAMLRRARHKAEASGVPFELSVGDARDLSFSDDSFDLVINNNMLGLLPKTVAATILEEMLRVVRPGGRLVVVGMRRPTRRSAQWIYRVGAGWLGRWNDVHVEPLIEAVGFDIVSRELVSQLGIPSEVLVARKPEPQAGARRQ